MEDGGSPLGWCLVGNVHTARLAGSDAAVEISRGTKIFRAGAKVYLAGCYHCVPPLEVVGRSRGGRWVSTIVHTRHLTGWRLRMNFRPAVVRALSRADKALSVDYRYRVHRGLADSAVIDRTSGDYRDYLEYLEELIKSQTENPWR